MVIGTATRRQLLAGLVASTAFPHLARAEDVVDLAWEDLLPESDTSLPAAFRNMLEQHDEQLPITSTQPFSSGVRTDWNGQIVRVAGFIVPVDYSGTSLTAFLLVPYVGACIHVPPPPANQLVFVTTPDPYENKGLFEPVTVTGMFGVSAISTELADVGYALSAEKIEPYA